MSRVEQKYRDKYWLKQPSTWFIHDLFSTLTSAFKDFFYSFTERTTDAGKPFFKPATKKRKVSTTDALTQIDKALEAFVSYQQAADRSFLAAEEARERREEEREERRRKEDQEFLLKLAQVLRK